MVQKLSHTPIYVTDQDKALDFYVNKLGFKVNTDMPMPQGGRWLTVTALEAPDLEIILMTPESVLPDEIAAKLREILDMNKMGGGVFNTADCRATYADLVAKGVEFRGEPKEEFYGTEAIMSDGCGNWFSLSTPKAF